MTTLYTYKIGWAYNASAQVLPNCPGTVTAPDGGQALPVYDLQGNPMMLVTDAVGKIPYFQAELPRIAVDFGAGPVPWNSMAVEEAAAKLPDIEAATQQAVANTAAAEKRMSDLAAVVTDKGVDIPAITQAVTANVLAQIGSTGSGAVTVDYSGALAKMQASFPGVTL